MTTEKFKWQGIVSKYAYPETWRSLWQVANSVIPFLLGWYLIYRSLAVGYWLTLLLAVPTAGFMVRCFIIFHDCCHGSFFKEIKTNVRLGLVTGVLVMTPYYHWKHEHAIHHATAGDLDRRAEEGNKELRDSVPPWSGLDIVVLALPRISNFDDFDPLKAESGVTLRYVSSASEFGLPNAVIIPGTKSTIADLDWLRQTGLAEAVTTFAKCGGAVVGICGGYQMLG